MRRVTMVRVMYGRVLAVKIVMATVIILWVAMVREVDQSELLSITLEF
jgi:hypothetical protein